MADGLVVGFHGETGPVLSGRERIHPGSADQWMERAGVCIEFQP